MEFRDLKYQYTILEKQIDSKIKSVLNSGSFIMGEEVRELEKELAEFVGVKHCISCANGTDALQLALMVWNVGPGDAIFVPDFTFFSTAEVVASLGATPIFVDVNKETYNISADALEESIINIIDKGKLLPKAIIAVDLFGLPAEYDRIRNIAKKYGLFLLEDGAQGFGGSIADKQACSFGDISTTSFFPAKPLGCYGDGGAIFTDDDAYAELLCSYRVHGKGTNKYDNVRIGMNSRLDTIQAAILQIKLKAFIDNELDSVQKVAAYYNKNLEGIVTIPIIPSGYKSSYAQYTIQLQNREERDELQSVLKRNGIPSMIYYVKPLHMQKAFASIQENNRFLNVAEKLCETVLSLPFHPYMREDEIVRVCNVIKGLLKER